MQQSNNWYYGRTTTYFCVHLALAPSDPTAYVCVQYQVPGTAVVFCSVVCVACGTCLCTEGTMYDVESRRVPGTAHRAGKKI